MKSVMKIARQEIESTSMDSIVLVEIIHENVGTHPILMHLSDSIRKIVNCEGCTHLYNICGVVPLYRSFVRVCLLFFNIFIFNDVPKHET